MSRKKAGSTRQEAMRILADAIIWLGGNGNGEYKGSSDCDAMSMAYEALSTSMKGFGVSTATLAERKDGKDERDTAQQAVSP